MSFKQLIKLIIVIYQNRGKNIHIHHTCNLKYKNANFEGGNVLGPLVTFEGSLGYGSYICSKSYISGKIGRYCSIASNVKVICGTHPTNYVSTHPCFYSTRCQSGFTYSDKNSFAEEKYADCEGNRIVIGNDVWIGADVLILSGVSIGDGAIIAAGAVVVKDVEPYSIVGGVPAKEIRKRFSSEQIQKLLDIKWWNQSQQWIKEHADSFGSIDMFLDLYSKNK